jgi:hypothetical protein
MVAISAAEAMCSTNVFGPAGRALDQLLDERHFEGVEYALLAEMRLFGGVTIGVMISP